MNTNIRFLPATVTFNVEQALASALSCHEQISEVLVVGYDFDGDLFIRSSRMGRKDALWLAEQLRFYALHAES